MCGIAGIFNYADPDSVADEALLVRMTRALRHRGPDDEGFYVNGPIGFGHRRLAIVDLTPTGHQPMANSDRSAWITYNGEFYNHDKFRERLLARGHVFRGTSDTETLLHLLESDGPDSLEETAGIFAFGYWDERRQELTLARDPLGVKPLYYYDDGRRILFASELKALLECSELPRDLDTEAINQYLHFHTALFDRTFFKQVKQVRAGEYLRVSRLRSTSRVYWKVEDFEKRSGSPEEQVAELEGMLQTVVGGQLMSDVPVGSFFSGGIDSSAVAAMAARVGKPPICFGVHFSDQGVIDERPYQEAAAKALGLNLQLITFDGSTFPEDLMNLSYVQDQPVIGAAMFPMYMVSRLASEQVKVCLGGQAADEIFGGYARYGLSRPWQVLSSWISNRQGASNGQGTKTNKVGGNLWLQVSDPRNVRRLLNNVSTVRDWQTRYFNHFAKVRESDWTSVFATPDIVSRSRCFETLQQKIAASPATDPADKVMHWDLQTYLTGLFHQDDRMSMACSLESRVPLADPRLVRFAFQTGFDLKFRAGATKWLLRQAVSKVLPEFVLNRRKVGFDTPAEKWVKVRHAGFVRDLLLSSGANQRGLWNPKGIAAWLEQPNQPHWFDVIWKVLCIEAWAHTFLSASPRHEDHHDSNGIQNGGDRKKVRDAIQEIRELGVKDAISRATWELKLRSGLGARGESVAVVPLTPQLVQAPGRVGVDESSQPNSRPVNTFAAREATSQIERVLPAVAPEEVAAVMREQISNERLMHLREVAIDALHGRIRCFGRWTADLGRPPDWHLNPVNRKRWNPGAHWSKVMSNGQEIGDVKLTWEAARFPQAYALARAAAFNPELRAAFAEAVTEEIKSFIEANPYGLGVHWNSGQEIAIRLMAWIFSASVFIRLSQPMDETARRVLDCSYQGAVHIQKNLKYAKTVANNHLISEALGLYLAGNLFRGTPEGESWRENGSSILNQEAKRQFYADGGYIMQSHNYHRSVLQMYLWASILSRGNSKKELPSWHAAMMGSLDFLFAQQNRHDGRLPNYGANDGALPSVLTACDFSDFRPILQALSLATREERIYDRGPWDEEAAWLLGPEALEVPLRPRAQKSISLPETGLHVARGNDPSSFCVLRCGNVRVRYSQIDMLHLDIWWRGLNVLVDGGSYLYSGAAKWHHYFARTGSHNTVQVDGQDQMLHYRRFKNLYWTKARLLDYREGSGYVLLTGEHNGFQRHDGDCVHRRSVLFLKDDVWIVYDQLLGGGQHDVRLHWLVGDFPYQYSEANACLALETPRGQFSITTIDRAGRQLAGSVVAGQADPPRGWVSRYYGEKAAAPSLAIERTTALSSAFITVLGKATPNFKIVDDVFSLQVAGGSVETRLTDEGLTVPDLD